MPDCLQIYALLTLCSNLASDDEVPASYYKISRAQLGQYINLDDGWAINRTAAGVLFADPALFPPSAPGLNDGIKLVADEVHRRGLLFGIYTARGSVTCLGRPGSDGHEQLDAETFASWGIGKCRYFLDLCGLLSALYWWHSADEKPSPADYLKEDSCGGSMHGSTWQQYARMRDALNSTGRRIFFSICEGVPFDDGPALQQMHCPYMPFTVKVRAPPAVVDLPLQSKLALRMMTFLCCASSRLSKPWVAEGRDPRTLANAFLVEYCNNFPWFGFTAAFDPADTLISKPGGFLSQLDSQALLTYDNLTCPGSFSDMDILQVRARHAATAHL